MSVRPPQILHKPKDDEDPLSQALQNEILNEKAATLFRLQKRLETAFESSTQQGRTQNPQRKQSLPTLPKRARRSGMSRYNGRCVD
jgi:hypothetical protein